MKKKVARLFSIYGGCPKEAGFFLVELQMSVAILAITIAALYGNFYQLIQGWQKMFLDMQLRDAGRYMSSILEKDLCYEGRLLTLTVDGRGRPKLICQTGHAGKIYTYTWENTSFYKSTKTTNTTGKNPLFVPDCVVKDVQMTKVGESFLKINFALEKQGRRQNFEQVYHCFNGMVIYE